MKHAKHFVLSLALAAVALTGIQAHASDPQVAIAGTVVSQDKEHLIVRTDKGDLTFEIDKNTVMPTDLPVGSRITVWYDSDEKLTGKIDARKIELLPADTQVTTPPPSTPPAYTPPPTPVETRTEVQTSTTTEEQLPKTASPLPLMGMTGALALVGGAFLLRRSRRA